jgi:hypothetical protein
LNAAAARAAGLGESPVCLIRFGGNDAAVSAQVAALGQVSRPEELETRIWLGVRQLDGDAHSTIRVSSLPQRVVAHAARMIHEDIPFIRTCIDPRRGIVRIIDSGPQNTALNQPARAARPTDDRFLGRDDQGRFSEVVFERLPAELWPQVSPSVVSDALSKGIRNAYDPHHVLNPGILGD